MDFSSAVQMDFDGATYNKNLDGKRLSSQLKEIQQLMADGQWRTLDEIKKIVCGSIAGISARLRDLRKPKFGGLNVERRRRAPSPQGVFEYRVIDDRIYF